MLLDGNVYSFKTAKICSGGIINFGGLFITSPGIYKDTINNIIGCDSILTLTVNLEGPDSNTLNQLICIGDTFTLNNKTYSSPGIYLDTFQNIYGCDSLITTINITTNSPRLTFNLIDTICENDTIYFNGKVAYNSGIYYDTIRTKENCDSIHFTLLLTQLKNISVVLNETICDDTVYNFNGNILTSSGSYTDTIVNRFGCDSTVTINLTINPTFYVLIDTQFCIQDSIYLINKIINQEGSNLYTFLNQYNCDSIIDYNIVNLCPNNIFVPNSFTPNGDGINDLFIPIFLDILGNYEFLIFNRWGELIFETNDITEGWNGKHKDVYSKSGSYIWKLKYTSQGETKSVIGHVQLLK